MPIIDQNLIIRTDDGAIAKRSIQRIYTEDLGYRGGFVFHYIMYADRERLFAKHFITRERRDIHMNRHRKDMHLVMADIG